MITNTGKSIVIKYLLGQAPSYASYIAAGCGPKPVEQMSFTVTAKAIESNIARLTVSPHNMQIGDYITVSDVDTTFNGIYQISAKTSTTVSYSKTAANVGTFSSPISVSPNGKVSRNYSNKQSLDFEMFRVPITSRGYVQEDGVSKVVLTASIPSSDRYEITELGIYSAASNPSAQLSDSKNLFLFVKGEGWEYHNESASLEIPTVVNKLDLQTAGSIYTGTGLGSEINGTEGTLAQLAANCFVADASNSTFDAELRVARQERSRNLGPSIFLRGNSSDLVKTIAIDSVSYTSTTATYTTAKTHGLFVGDVVTTSGLSPSGYNGTFTVTGVNAASKTFTVANTTNASVSDGVGTVELPRFSAASGAHIHAASNINLTLDENSPTDELHAAFSVVSVSSTSDGESFDAIGSVRVMLRFANSHQTDPAITAFAQMDIDLSSTDYDFATNRYFVATQQLQDLNRYGSFTWRETSVVLAYASVLDTNGDPMDEYYVALDGLRLENVSSFNPLYGLTGYTIIENSTQGTTGTYPKPIIKLPNTSNFIEFRYSLDVI